MSSSHNFEIEHLDPFGVSLTGVDCSGPVAPELAAELIAAITTHLVVVIRGQHLSAADQIRFTTALGTPERSWDVNAAHPDDPRIQVIDSRTRPPGIKSTSQVWHTDQSFTARPSLFTILHAFQIPSAGGETQFADMRAAFERLPSELADCLSSAYGIHSYNHELGQVRAERYSAEGVAEESNRFPDVHHPLVRTHHITGRHALYLNRLCLTRIEDLDPDDSAQLLARLYDHALVAQPIYVHEWKAGDLLLWDNPSLMHRGTPSPASEVRVLHRTTTEGPIPQPRSDN
jgi:alpha-ketoglutarate-dependent taurine dioxygenase